MSELIARSPVRPVEPAVVAGWEVSGRRSTAALTLADHTPLAKAAVRASPGGALAWALGVPHRRAARDTTGALVIGSAPGEWLVLAPPGEQTPLCDRLAVLAAGAGELVTILDLTHGHAVMRLTGEQAAATLVKVCGIDFSDRVTPDGAAFRSSVAKLVTGVVRDDQPGPAGRVRSYLLYCERSYGQYLFGAVLEAGAEFGVDVDGFRVPGI